MNAKVVVELCGGDGQILDMLHHLESREGHSLLEVFIGEVALALGELRVSPGKDG